MRSIRKSVLASAAALTVAAVVGAGAPIAAAAPAPEQAPATEVMVFDADYQERVAALAPGASVRVGEYRGTDVHAVRAADGTLGLTEMGPGLRATETDSCVDIFLAVLLALDIDGIDALLASVGDVVDGVLELLGLPVGEEELDESQELLDDELALAAFLDLEVC